ncbi:MAG: hypothetical protein Q7S24_00790 [bacterium]|nr:hypothetical protein [bacterium]
MAEVNSRSENLRYYKEVKGEIAPITLERAIEDKNTMMAYDALQYAQTNNLSMLGTMKKQFIKFIDGLMLEIARRENSDEQISGVEHTELSERKKLEMMAFLAQLKFDATTGKFQSYDFLPYPKTEIVSDKNLDRDSAGVVLKTELKSDIQPISEIARKISEEFAPHIFKRAINSEDIMTACDQLTVLKYSTPEKYLGFKQMLLDLIHQKLEDGYQEKSEDSTYTPDQLRHFLQLIDRDNSTV